jgi:hypothetical protein
MDDEENDNIAQGCSEMLSPPDTFITVLLAFFDFVRGGLLI